MFVSEEYRIARSIKDFIEDKEPSEYFYIMLRNGRIIDTDSYYNMVSSGKINPQDAYTYIGIGWDSSKLAFYYPFLGRSAVLLNAYPSKLGFHYLYFAVPATGLKYVADVERYGEHLSIEVTDLDTVVNNTNLPKIVVEVVGKKLINGEQELTRDEFDKIYDTFSSQRLFAGYNVEEAWNIVLDYYDRGNKSLAKEVARIAIDYDRIFQPYTVCYDMDNWKEIDCWSIK